MPILWLQLELHFRDPAETAHDDMFDLSENGQARAAESVLGKNKAYLTNDEMVKSGHGPGRLQHEETIPPALTQTFLKGSFWISLFSPLLQSSQLPTPPVKIPPRLTHISHDTTALVASQTPAPASTSNMLCATLEQIFLPCALGHIIPVGTQEPGQTHYRLHLTPLLTSTLALPKPSFQDISTEETLATLQSQSIATVSQGKTLGPRMPCFLSTWYSNFNSKFDFQSCYFYYCTEAWTRSPLTSNPGTRHSDLH